MDREITYIELTKLVKSPKSKKFLSNIDKNKIVKISITQFGDICVDTGTGLFLIMKEDL